MISNKTIEEIVIINRRKELSEGIIMDTISAFPEFIGKLKAGDYVDTADSDVVLITAGETMKPGQHPLELIEVNKKIVENILSKIKLKKDAVLIMLPTQVDIIAEFAQKISQHDPAKVIGFGGLLDVNRLKCILHKETGKE